MIWSQPWFFYSVLAVVCWSGFAITAKLASHDVPPEHIQFYFGFGGAPVALAILIRVRFRIERNWKGVCFGVGNGLLSGVGSLALFAAFRSGGSTGIITTTTALYPLVTVILARLVLKERLTRRQNVGLCFAAAALIIFSLQS